MTGSRTTRTTIVLASILASGATVLSTVEPGEAATQPRQPTAVVAGYSADRTLRDAALREPMGLAVDPSRPTTVFTVDGSRKSLGLVVVGATGRTRARWTLRGATAGHVTDIALGRGRQVWIGDIGDRGRRTRSQIKVFRISRPGSVSNRSVAWSAFRLRYPDGAHDAQALLVNPLSGRLFVVTHSATRGAVYEAPARLKKHSVSTLRKVATAPRDVTGGEYARSGRLLALTHGDAVTVYRSFKHPSSQLALPAGAHPGYVAFTQPSSAVLVGSRKRRATLLRVRLTPAPKVAPVTPVAQAADSSADLMAQLGWRGVQEPRPDSITLLDPSALPASPTPLHPGSIMRTELRDGETVTTSGYTAHRAEVYGRNPIGSWTGTPASQWPDPVGSTRWYDFSMYMPADFPVATDARWFDFTQWKGLRGGSPPVALEIHRNDLRLGGSRVSRSLGTVNRGGWTHFTVGIHFSTSATDGWVEVYRNGHVALPRLSMETMDIVNGQPDPIYLKQGIYRSSVWHVTQVLYDAPMQVTTTNPLLG